MGMGTGIDTVLRLGGRNPLLPFPPAASDKGARCWGRCNADEAISKRLLQIGVGEVKIRDEAVG